MRELENLVERVSVIAEGSTIFVRDLPPPLSEELEARFEISPVTESVRLPAAPIGFPPPSVPTPTPEPIAAQPLAETMSPEQLTDMGLESEAEMEHRPLDLPVSLPTLLKRLEDAYIAKALSQSGGNKKEAARLLGMGRTTLVEKLRRRNSDTSAA